jgi:tetratricopeptide (TPR) repeat protein
MVVLWLGLLVMGFDFAFNVYRVPASYLEEMLNYCSTPAHLFAAMLIGISLALFLSVVVALRPAKTPVLWSCAVLLALPLIPLTRNWRDCNQHSNDFAYLFGHRLFEPGGDYLPMEKNAILFGGTDDARFVSTYMIFCESQVAPQNRFQDKQFDRSDIYILAQNALADTTYMSYIRDQYDFSRPTNTGLFQRLLGRDYSYPQMPIYLPGQQDSNKAFQQYIEDVRANRIFSGRNFKIIKGLISGPGVSGVMCINGILARWIFDHNKEQHSFYVEESYVIPWMYPHLRPAGIILKLEKQPLPSPEENPVLWQAILTRDQAYWDKLTAELLARADFHRNEAAQKCFSKLRVAIARVYAFRELNVEAENVLQQALQLWPQSPDASFQLAALYLGQYRYRMARSVIETYLKLDPTNQQARDLLETIHIAEKDDIRRQELEGQTSIRNGSANIDLELELAAIYQRQGMDTELERLVPSLISGTNLPPRACATLATLCRGSGQGDLHMAVLQYWLRNDANDFTVWVELAFAELAQNRQEKALAAFKRAIELGGSNALLSFRFDPRLEPLRNSPEFQSLITPQ